MASLRLSDPIGPVESSLFALAWSLRLRAVVIEADRIRAVASAARRAEPARKSPPTNAEAARPVPAATSAADSAQPAARSNILTNWLERASQLSLPEWHQKWHLPEWRVPRRRQPRLRVVGGARAAHRPVATTPRSRSRHALVRSFAVVSVSLIAASFVALPIVGYARASAVRGEIDAAWRRAEAIAIIDQAGRVGGVRRQPGVEAGRLVMSLRKPPPAPFWAMLRWAEDRHAHVNYFGISLHDTAWAAACWGGGLAGLRDELNQLRRCTGGSTLLSAIPNAVRGTGNPHRALGIKVREMLDTAAVATYRSLDDPRTQALIADSGDYAMGAGGEVSGFELGARAVFGKTPNQLSTAEQSILVTAFRNPIALSCDPSADAPGGWGKRIDYAKTIVGGALAVGAKRDTALAELEQMRARPIVHPAIDDPLLSGLPWREACLAAGNPVARANLVASSIALQVDAELARIAPQGVISEVRVGADLVANRAFALEMVESLGELRAAQRSRFMPPQDESKGQWPDGAFVIADRTGSIRRIALLSARHDLSTLRRIASLGKLIVIVAAAIDGRGLEPLCTRRDRLTNVRNSDGFAGYDKCEGPALRAVRDAVASSDNLALLDLARTVRPASLKVAIAMFGGKVPPGVALSNAAALGMIEIAPARLLADIAALEGGITGGEQAAIADVPTLLENIRVDRRWIRPRSRIRAVDLRRAFATERGRELVTAAASAALSPGGTLAATVDPSHPLTPNEIAKSGTDSDDESRITAKYVLAARSNAAWFGGIWSPRDALGSQINAQPLWRALRTATFVNEDTGHHGT